VAHADEERRRRRAAIDAEVLDAGRVYLAGNVASES
jgi:hypothetical protein